MHPTNTFIKALIQRFRRIGSLPIIPNNKPKYAIKHLYIGQIVCDEYEKLTTEGHSKQITHELYEKDVKSLAILYRPHSDKSSTNTYIHLYTGQQIDLSQSSSNIKTLKITNAQPFEEVMREFMREYTMTAETRLSLNQITSLENFINKVCSPDLQPNDLSWH